MTTITPLSRKSAVPSKIPSTIKPILRKSVIPAPVLGKRRATFSPSDDEDDDGDDANPGDRAPLQSPSKKRKTVAFIENLTTVQKPAGKTIDDARQEIKAALECHAQADDQGYDTLKHAFAPVTRKISDDDDDDGDENEDISQRDLIVYVVAMQGFVTQLDRTCQGLVCSILRCTWLERDEVFAKVYVQLLAQLSSAQGFLLPEVLGMMVDKFSQTSKPLPNVPGFPPVDPERKREWLHNGLQHLIELFPVGCKIILRLVSEKFPFTEQSKRVHLEYIDHLLWLKAARPELERDIMEMILSKVVKLDVEMTLSLEGNTDEVIAQAVLRQLEAGDADDEDDSDLESDAGDDMEAGMMKKVLLLKRKFETLDAVLDVLFSIYDPIFENPDSPEALEAFEDLLTDFSNVILPHLKSRHTQYLLFHYATKSGQLVDMFIGTLFNLAFESNRASVVKQAAVSYLASFTARGAKLESKHVQQITKTFLDYIDHYRATHANCRGPDLRRYGQYYAYFQGLLYIFCFRWRDLIDKDALPSSLDWDDPAAFLGQDLPWMRGLKSRLQANIASKLNPLKCVAPGIVEEFAELSHHLGLMYIYPQIEQNKSIHLSQFFTSSYALAGALTGGALRDTGCELDDEKWTQLESCFPFDPFQLPISGRRLDLENSYNEWKPFAVLNREEEEDEDDEEDSDTEGEVVDDTATDDESDDD